MEQSTSTGGCQPPRLTTGSILVELIWKRVSSHHSRSEARERPIVRRRRQHLGFAAIIAACLIAAAWGVARSDEGRGNAAGREFTDNQIRFFEDRVRPILESRCWKCHGRGEKIRGGFRLDSRAGVLRGGELGPAVDLDRADESLLIKAIRYDELEMPPGGKLSPGDVDVLMQWVKEGLPWTPGPDARPGSATATPATAAATIISARREWSHQSVVRPAVPPVKDPAWCRNPIDAFLLAQMEAKRLRPAPEADRVTLIRRLTYDLTGLPPTPEEVDAFLDYRAPRAYERLVDRLLGSPGHGERWARHWLDLVRYGETHGYERDAPKPFVWRYRDYVIDAFNRDIPYDRFVREQVAGDEISPGSLEALIATGFYRLGLWDDEPADRPLARYDMLDGVVSTTGQVFLGMSINCARCHDHKVDPIPQRDYYRLLACFIDVTQPDGKSLKKVKAGPGPPIEVMCVGEAGRAQAHVLLRGNPGALGPAVEPGIPCVLDPGAGSIARGGGKRRALAGWLTATTNPRTARVLVNRLWQYHCGRGIVATPNDFGKLGEPPTQPELLDWLAAELMSGGWRIKRIHRLIVQSSAYRMSSRATHEQLATDPSNQWLSRFPMRRLAAEEVRDSILSASGTLNRKAAGPSVYPRIPSEVLAGQSMPGNGWPTSAPHDAARRSIYVHVKRSLMVPILEIHDAADTDSSCPVRYTTTVPSQALGLLNGDFSNEQAPIFAERLRREAPADLEGQVHRAIRLTTSRRPEAHELHRDLEFIRKLTDELRVDQRAALSQYCLLLLNSNAFIYVD
jgi:hypothetical protein